MPLTPNTCWGGVKVDNIIKFFLVFFLSSFNQASASFLAALTGPAINFRCFTENRSVVAAAAASGCLTGPDSLTAL